MLHQTTDEMHTLYIVLRQRDVSVQLEKSDGYKHIDINIPEAKVNIKVDGDYNNYSTQQTLADLKRIYCLLRKRISYNTYA